MANTVVYGFMSLKDLFARRVSTVGVEVITRAIAATVEEHNRQMAAFLRLFAFRTTSQQERYHTPAAARLQSLDEAGRARPIKPGGFYDLAFPLQMGGAAWGQDYVTRQKMTVSEANDATFTLISADVRWMRDHVLAAIYANANWTFPDPQFGDLTVKGPANGDTDKYLIQAGADQGTTDTHFLAQAAGIADGSNPFPTIYDELTEHPENGGEVISFIPTNLRATTEALTNFKEFIDPNIRPGNASDQLVGSLDVTVPGTVIGYVDRNWIVEWKSLSNDYIVSIPSLGERPLAMREDPEPELNGFNRVASRDDHPFYEAQYLRRAGFGARNRVGSLVYRIGNAAYAIPTGYTNPMP